MKIFIFGSTGMLGNYMKSLLLKNTNVITLNRKDYDLSNLNISSLDKLLKSKNLQKNDIIINCAGVIPQASKQRGLNTRLYFTINSLFPVILSQLCDKYESKMIHITTDCVFSGREGNYNENSIHDEINDYGLSKSLGELCKATIIRTSIIGEEVNNKRSLLEWVKSNSGKEINGYTNHFWNGVTCLQLAKIVEKIILENKFWNGIRHIFSPRSVSKFELVSMINSAYNLGIKINKFETETCIDKTIISLFNENNYFNIPDLSQQIIEQKNFILL
tara:strand:- start:17857 stop:18681 length:825 start_codon:yes stop_codon:yes gene_type:complete